VLLPVPPRLKEGNKITKEGNKITMAASGTLRTIRRRTVPSVIDPKRTRERAALNWVLRRASTVKRCRDWRCEVRGLHEARFLRSISCHIMGVNISCIASGILLPGQTMVFGRDMKEAGNIDSR
jgi:hypothetical protein